MKFRLIVALILVPFPSFLKKAIYRLLFGYRFGRGVKIGLSAIVAGKCEIGARTRIGHLNLLYRTADLQIGSDVIIGVGNRILGGDRVEIGDRCQIFRFNEINSILDPLAVTSFEPVLKVGAGSVITVNHKIDFTDRVEFGENVVFAGRNSNIWTHNRQKAGPVTIGRNCYVGANVQFVANTSVGDYCVIGLGSVITKPIVGDWGVVAGMPAQYLKPLDEESKVLVTYPTRPDLEPVQVGDNVAPD